MQSLANETGGEAFVNTNGFSDALNKVIREGSQYFTLAYRPSNGSMHGEYRTIKVVVNDWPVISDIGVATMPGNPKSQQRETKENRESLLFRSWRLGCPTSIRLSTRFP